MAVAQNPYLIVANGANTIQENQYYFHVWSYITFLWTTAHLCPFVSLKEAMDLQQWIQNKHLIDPLLFVVCGQRAIYDCVHVE